MTLKSNTSKFTKAIALTIILFFSLISYDVCFAVKIDCKRIESYKNVKKKGKCKGEVHHLIEKRFAECFGVDPDLIPSICLSKDDHRIFTNRWREKIPYQGEYNCLIVVPLVIKALLEVYKDNPCAIKELKDFIWKIVKRMPKNSLKYAKPALRTGVGIATLILAYEVYMVFANLDDHLRDDRYVEKAFGIATDALDLHQNGRESAAIEKLGEAYYLLGFACYHKMLQYRTDYLKEVTDRFSDQSWDYANMAIDYLTKSIQLNDTIPYAFFCLAVCFEAVGDFENAKSNYPIARDLFLEEGNSELADEVNERINQIN